MRNNGVKAMHEYPEEKPMTLETFTAGIWKENPVFSMTLGLCSTLAVTNTLENALAMSVSTAFVLVCSSALVSALRKFFPKQIRITAYIVIIATFVTVVDYVMQAVSLDLYNKLGAFLQLIVVNCIILGRAEAYASRNGVLKSVVNSIGMGLGYTLALSSLGGVREILGMGTLFGMPLFGSHFEPWVIMVLPPGGFFVLGSWLLLFNWLEKRKLRRRGKVIPIAIRAAQPETHCMRMSCGETES